LIDYFTVEYVYARKARDPHRSAESGV